MWDGFWFLTYKKGQISKIREIYCLFKHRSCVFDRSLLEVEVNMIMINARFSGASDKEYIWVSDRIWTHGFLNSVSAVTELQTLFGELGRLPGSRVLHTATTLDNCSDNIRPLLSPLQCCKKRRVLLFARVYHWFGEKGGLISHFILFKLVGSTTS